MLSTDGMRSLLLKFRDKYRVPAVGAAVVAGGGGLLVEVVGVRRRDNDAPALTQDRWHIGSCGKSITAALYARLVERGEAEWGAPVTALFPDLAGRIDPAWRDRTIDEVLVCRAGMRGNLTRNEMMAALHSDDSMTEQRTRAAVAALSESPGRRGRFIYSNLGYIVAGAAIDRIAGAPFENALAEHVHGPLGIGSGGIGPPPEIWGHKCRVQIGDLCLGKGPPCDPVERHSDNPAVLNSAGRFHLTLSDWARFLRVFLADGGDFLRPRTIEHLLRVPPGRGVPMAMGWAKATGLGDVSYGMQGSNTFWSASALLDRSRERAALVACNDGRTRVLRATTMLAAKILDRARM
jgi:D-alanyl-D-alanine carboxypeptidase